MTALTPQHEEPNHERHPGAPHPCRLVPASAGGATAGTYGSPHPAVVPRLGISQGLEFTHERRPFPAGCHPTIRARHGCRWGAGRGGSSRAGLGRTGLAKCRSSPDATTVAIETMRDVYEEVKTPYRYGPVVTTPPGADLVDSPSVFRYRGRWYMVHLVFRNNGYEGSSQLRV